MEIIEGAAPFLKDGCVLTIGNFDGMHIAHRELIFATVRQSKQAGLPAVVWSFKEHPQSLLRPDTFRYILSGDDKARLIEALGADIYYRAEFEDYKSLTAEEFVRDVLVGAFNVKQVLCGFDFSFGKGGSGTPERLDELLGEYGVRLSVLPAVMHGGAEVSSTRIRGLITQGKVEEAAQLLGRYYSFKLPVCQGKRLGRELGTPTINQRLPQDFVQPAYGVYAVLCDIDGKVYGGVSNIGTRPTVTGGAVAPVCETYILDYNGNLYGKEVRVYLYRYLRAEQRFDSLAALKESISADVENARQALSDAILPKGEYNA